jgi:putative aldouronate transport system substrate-binding protein
MKSWPLVSPKIMKFLSLLIILALASGLMSACTPAATTAKSEATAATTAKATTAVTTTASTAPGGVAKTGLPVVKDKLTLKALVAKDSKVPDWNEHPATIELEARTNIHVVWECVPDAGFVEKRNLLFATNALPDFILRAGIGPDLEVKYATSKQLVAVDTLFDYAPYYSAAMKLGPSFLKNIQSPDGHVYSMPMLFSIMGGLVNKYWINTVWLKNLGLAMPATTEEFYQTLKKFVANDANGNGKKDELGICGPYKSPFTLLNYFQGSWGFGKNSSIINNIMDVDDNGKIRLIMTDPQFKDELAYFHKLWAEGLMDKDCFSQDATQVASKADNDLIGFCAYGNNTQFLGKNRNNFDQPPSLKGPTGKDYWVNTNTYVYSTGTAVICSSTKYPQAAMRYIDYLYSEDGTKIVRLGIEGKSYQKNADGTYALLDIIKKDPNGLTQDQALSKWVLYMGGGMPQYAIDSIDLSAAQLPEIKKATNTVVPNLVSLDKIPRLHFTADESTRLSSSANDINTYINENIVSFITGQRDLATWDTYVAELEKMKIKDFLAVYQAAYDRWLKG